MNGRCRMGLPCRLAAGLVAAQLLIPTGLAAPPRATTSELTLDAAVEAAIAQDPWLGGSRHREQALRAEGEAAAALPDPTISLSAANLPVTDLDIGQENMTQLALGISQRFPRGQTRQLARQQKGEEADRQPILRADRRAKLTAEVTVLWLAAYGAEESIRLIETDRALFEQLAEAAEVSYASAAGTARAQDLIRAQLELTRLDDRLTTLRQNADAARSALSAFIGPAAQRPLAGAPLSAEASPPSGAEGPTPAGLDFARVRHHPAVLALDRQLEMLATGVDLARQQYRPGWTLSAQYGYRDQDPLGRDRDDLLSVGLTFDLPVFTARRQDPQVHAARARREAAQTERALLLRQLLAALEAEQSALQRIDQRLSLYRERLMPQMRQQAEASLAAYDNADGDFAEAVRARIAELDAKIEALHIGVARQQALARLGYLNARAPLPEDAS